MSVPFPISRACARPNVYFFDIPCFSCPIDLERFPCFSFLFSVNSALPVFPRYSAGSFFFLLDIQALSKSLLALSLSLFLICFTVLAFGFLGFPPPEIENLTFKEAFVLFALPPSSPQVFVLVLRERLFCSYA